MTTTKAGAHTQGRLHVCSHSNKVIRNDAGIWVADCNKLAGPTDGSVADAERLVACWNACEGLTQDHFDGGWTALGLSKHAKRMEDELAAARQELIVAHDRMKSLTDKLRKQDRMIARRVADDLAARALLEEALNPIEDCRDCGSHPVAERITAFLKGQK